MLKKPLIVLNVLVCLWLVLSQIDGFRPAMTVSLLPYAFALLVLLRPVANGVLYLTLALNAVWLGLTLFAVVVQVSAQGTLGLGAVLLGAAFSGVPNLLNFIYAVGLLRERDSG